MEASAGHRRGIVPQRVLRGNARACRTRRTAGPASRAPGAQQSRRSPPRDSTFSARAYRILGARPTRRRPRCGASFMHAARAAYSFATPCGTCPPARAPPRTRRAASGRRRRSPARTCAGTRPWRPAQEHRLVDLDVPVHQRADRALVRGARARGDERRAQLHRHVAVVRGALQPVQRLQQRLERARRQRPRRVVGLVLLERIEPFGAIDALALVAEEHCVAVERDAHFLGCGSSRDSCV